MIFNVVVIVLPKETTIAGVTYVKLGGLSWRKPKETVKETVVVQQQGNASVAPLLKRAFMFLEDGDFSRADEFCEQVLNLDPENAEAYLGKLMAEQRFWIIIRT